MDTIWSKSLKSSNALIDLFFSNCKCNGRGLTVAPNLIPYGFRLFGMRRPLIVSSRGKKCIAVAETLLLIGLIRNSLSTPLISDYISVQDLFVCKILLAWFLIVNPTQPLMCPIAITRVDKVSAILHVHKVSKVLKVLYTTLQKCTLICIQILSNVSKYRQLYPNIVKCIQILSNVSKYCQMFSITFKCFQFHSNVLFNDIQMYPNSKKCLKSQKK